MWSPTSTHRLCILLPMGTSFFLENQRLAKSESVQTLSTCKSNDTLVAALYFVNYHFMRFMVVMTCTNKIRELQNNRHKVHENCAEILVMHAAWHKFHNIGRWSKYTANFAKLSAAVDFVYNCVSFDQDAMESRVKQLKKDYEQEETSDGAESEDESYDGATESDRSNAATEDSP